VETAATSDAAHRGSQSVERRSRRHPGFPLGVNCTVLLQHLETFGDDEAKRASQSLVALEKKESFVTLVLSDIALRMFDRMNSNLSLGTAAAAPGRAGGNDEAARWSSQP
jgi:hypothetical protein